MKALLLAPELFVRERGIQRILRLYLRALGELTASDGSVEVVVLNDASLPAERLQACGANQVTTAVGCGRNKLRFIWEVLRRARRTDLIVCGHLHQLPVAWAAARLHRRLRYLLVAHGIEVWHRYPPMQRRALRGAARILCVSEYTREEMRSRLTLPPERFVVLPNALDPRLQEPAATSGESGPLILTVARLEAHDRDKGIDHLIRSLPAVHATIPDARLCVVGTGEGLAPLESLAHKLGLENVVEFTGLIDDAGLARRYAACRVFALPSRKEGFGIVFLEAMAQGKPCIGARAGGIPEIIDETCGRLVPFGDVAALAQACTDALTRSWDPAAIRRRADAFSYERFRERLSHVLSTLP